MMLQPAMRSNWRVCDALPFSTTRHGSPDVASDVAGWSAYPSIAAISIRLPDRREGTEADSEMLKVADCFQTIPNPAFPILSDRQVQSRATRAALHAN